jgi:DNA ligase-1
MQYKELAKIYENLEKNSSRLKKIEILSEFLIKLKKSKNPNFETLYLLQGTVFPDFDEREFGISDKLCIKALVKASGISEHEIMKSWKELGDLGLVAQKVIGNKKQNTLFSTNLNVDKIINNLKKLPTLTGIGAVDKKMAIISELLTSATGIEAKYIIRTLLSDLRIGVAAGTLRDSITQSCFEKTKENLEVVQEAYDKSTDWKEVFKKAIKGIKELEKIQLSPGKAVKVMLYPKENTIEDAFERVGKPCLIDYKYDGFRMMINKDENGKIKIFTRRLDEVTVQFPEVKEYVEKYVKEDSFIIDAEAVGFDPLTKKYKPFQEISQRIKRKYDIEKVKKTLPIELNVFDIIYYNGKSLIKTPLSKRREIIEKIIPKKEFKLKPSTAIITDSVKVAEKFYKEALKDGEEGIMMKNLNSPYKPGARVGHGVKIKPGDSDFDLIITGAEYGTGKRAGWLTSFKIACQNEGELFELGHVSTGLKEKEEEGLSFEELTNLLKPLIKKETEKEITVKPKLVVTVAYQNIQKSTNYNSGYALRFPRITRLRPDRGKSDIATLHEIEKDYKKEN